MTIDPPNVTKADVYANYVAAQDLGERLARQIEINQVLRAEKDGVCIDAHKLEIELAGANEEIGKLHDDLNALASRPCLACDVVHPAQVEALTERAYMLEAELRGALCMLDLVKVEEGSLYVGTIEQFIRDRADLNESFKRLTSAQNA